MVGMAVRFIKHFEIAGNDMSSFVVVSRDISPVDEFDEDHLIVRFLLRLIRRAESDQAVEKIRHFIATSGDPDHVEMRLNWEPWVGRVEIDDKHADEYVFTLEKTEAV